MISKDEYYLKHALEAQINTFIEEELSAEHDIGYLPDYLARTMTEAAYAVLASVKDTNDYLQRENLLK